MKKNQTYPQFLQELKNNREKAAQRSAKFLNVPHKRIKKNYYTPEELMNNILKGNKK